MRSPAATEAAAAEPLFDDEFPQPEVVDCPWGRAKGLILVRESQKYEMTIFDAMRFQTLHMLKDIPAVQAVNEVGMAPFKCRHGEVFYVTEQLPDGSSRPHPVPVEVREKGSTKIWLFYYDGYWHAWCQASAAKVTNGINEFTDLLIDILYEKMPMELYAANFSRLIRSTRQAGQLQTAVLDCVDTIVTETQPFPMANENQIGLTLFNVFAMTVSQERSAIVRRTFCGRIAGYNRGEWPLGKGTVVFGFKWDAKAKQLVPDTSLQPNVEEMLRILAMDAPPSEKQRLMGAAGVTSTKKLGKDGKPALVTELDDATALVNSFLAWVPLWTRGEFLLRHANSIVGLNELSGVPVVRRRREGGPLQKDAKGRMVRPEADLGEFQMLCKVATPPGGWAPPDVLAAAEAAAIANTQRLLNKGRTPGRPVSASLRGRSDCPELHARILSPLFTRGNDLESEARRTAARAHKRISPLTGWTWTDDKFNYEAQMTNGLYRILRWPLNTIRTALTRPGGLPTLASDELDTDDVEDLSDGDYVEDELDVHDADHDGVA